ncbi:MAG TPA: alpha-2-macroglobulin [Xanthobacteraceae bacterium]|nr:alpha-2-macroglobulin [Xanthobacteraceae bacterium]
MLASARVGLIAALIAISCVPAVAQKAFQRDDLSEAVIKFEAQIKTESGPIAKSLAELRRDADIALQRNDPRNEIKSLGQIVVVAPNDSANWLRLSRAILKIGSNVESERLRLLDRAGTAAYAAYQRTTNKNEEADALVILGRTLADRKQWRPALDALRYALDLREVADVRGLYERLREDHGFRMLDYTVDSDSASPRACFQFSEELPVKRVDFSPYVAVQGIDKPALSADDKQLCVEGLKHGERYNVTLRAGLPSVVRETLPKSSSFTIYVRDRKPSVRFSDKAYLLPRTGQRGIPIISVNTKSVSIEIYRIGDRSLTDTVFGRDFQRNLGRYQIERLAEVRGGKVWQGELTVEQTLNADVTTAFPVDQAAGNLAPGVYVMVAQPTELKSPDNYDALATQWFIVSDLGLTSYFGNDGIHVFVHSLASAEPKGQVEVRLLSRGNEVLATKQTNSSGYVHFEAGLTRGEGAMSPAMVVATEARGNDYAFLSLKTSAFDLSDRGVAGRTVPAGLDAFVYTERGVYRSGETVYVTALLRDAQGIAATNAPLTLVVERPDGLEYRRVLVADQGVGGRSLSVPISANSSTGTWRVRAYTDPKRPAVGETSFMVEDYVPDRLEFDLASPTGKLAQGSPADVTVDGRYLYGAPAAGLELEGEIVYSAAKERTGFAGYLFGPADEEVAASRQPLTDLPQTDQNGKARFKVTALKVPASTRPLEAQVVVRMAEAGGRAVERKIVLPITPNSNMIGVKPLFSGRSLADGAAATFDVQLVAPDGKSVARKGAHYELLRVETHYQWYRRDGSWDWESIKSTRRIADGKIDLVAGKPTRISVPVQWGRYRLEVSTGEPSVPVTTVSFDAGWYTEASADTPDMLEIALDKPEYKPGESMTVAVTARTAGKVTLDVIGDKLATSMTQDVQPGTARIKLDVGKDWGNGAYVVATLRRPLDAKAQRMPGRAIGVQWFAIDRKAHTLALDMKMPQLTRPNGKLVIPLKVDGLAAGEDARVVVAAVDVGILNLTNYKPPAPDDYYLGQRRLTAEIRDLYGQLIDGMQGTRGAIKTGGDSAGAELSGSPPTQAPLALYSGLITVKPDGTAEVSFDIPAFAGTVRVMAVAWSKDKVGRANGDVVVRDPVVLTATLPRFLLTGDRGTLHLDFDNVEGPAGDYNVTVKADGAISVGDNATQTVKLAAKKREAITMPLNAAAAGIANVSIKVAGPGGFMLERSYPMTVRPATQILTRRLVKPIAKGESLTLSNDLFADLVPGTGSVAISVGMSTALDAATLLKSLDRYPFGCSEQITSRAMPLLYVNELAAEAHLALDTAIDQRIRDAIDRVLARQGSNGSFGLWGLGGDDIWLDSYVTDFLTRARERGFTVPDTAFKLALDRLRNFVGNESETNKNGGRELAYALYVLARNGAAPLGDLRYLADSKLDSLTTPIAKAQLAAALGLLGDRVRAERVYNAAIASLAAPTQLDLFSRSDYGSTLRDAAAMVTLVSETNGPRPVITTAVQRIEQARAYTVYTSTQENAWMVLAARAISKDAANVLLDVGGEARKGSFYRNVRASELAQPLKITNASAGPLQAVVSVSGAPTTPEPAAEKGFKLERKYYTLDGDPVDITKVKQNQRFAVVLKITEPQPQYGRLILADYLPAGFEIDNPRLVSSGDTGTLGWIPDAVEPVYSEFRDDRFSASFERKAGNPAIFTVAYVVRAVSPGRYILPQAYIEDMYRPDRYGRTETGTVEIQPAK